ncbi:unnamed protein product, partial [Prorocentrum cordatum]
ASRRVALRAALRAPPAPWWATPSLARAADAEAPSAWQRRLLQLAAQRVAAGEMHEEAAGLVRAVGCHVLRYGRSA